MKDKLATRKIADMSHLANAYLKRFSKKKNRKSIWKTFLDTIQSPHADFEYQRIGAKMINCLLMLFDLEARVDFRADLDTAEYPETLNNIKKGAESLPAKGEEVLKDMDLYFDILQEDSRECAFNDLDMTDLDQLFKYIKESCEQDSTSYNFRRCMHAFALIPKDEASHIWNVCAKSLTYAARTLVQDNSIISPKISQSMIDSSLMDVQNINIAGEDIDDYTTDGSDGSGEAWAEINYSELIAQMQANMENKVI